MSTTEQLLSVLQPDERDRPVSLLKQAPALVERLTGRRRHRSTLWRDVMGGVAGVKLKAIGVGGTLMVTPRAFVEYWVAIGEARSNSKRRGGRVAGGDS